MVLNTNLEGRPGAQYIYSDLGADVLGLIIEVVAGEPLDKFLARSGERPHEVSPKKTSDDNVDRCLRS